MGEPVAGPVVALISTWVPSRVGTDAGRRAARPGVKPPRPALYQSISNPVKQLPSRRPGKHAWPQIAGVHVECAPVFLLFFLSVATAAFAQPAPATSEPPVLQVPGGVKGLAPILGISEDLPRARVLLTAIRVLWEAPEGVDPELDRRRAQVLEYLRGAEAAAQGSTVVEGDAVPAFLLPGTWATVLNDEGARPTFTGILGNRRAALLYYGLASLDPSTRAYLLARPTLLRQLSGNDRAAIFATLGRSLHVREGRMQVPGGAEAVPLWEDVAGDAVGNPAAFMLRLVSKNGGRLALLYDGIAHLEEGARRFALGLQLPAEHRVKRFRAFYDASGEALSKWGPGRRPFERMPFDAVHLLLSMNVGPRGEVPGPAWTALWKAVFDGAVNPEDGAPGKADLEADGRLDAARLLELVALQDPLARRERSETWLFANRVFRDVPPSAATDLLVALKGFPRYPSLALTLERMGIDAPATYAAAVRAARRLSGADRRLWQFQAALALVERARAARSIDERGADGLVRALCAITPEGGDEYRGAVARWLERDFLAEVGEVVLPSGLPATDRPLELRVLAAMAGSVASPRNTALLALPPLEWEGLRYRVDPGGATLHRLSAMRTRQGGRPLDDVLAFARIADALAAASSPATAMAAAQRLGEAAARLLQPNEASRPSRLPGDEPQLDKLVAEALDRTRKLKAEGDGKATANIARPLQEAVDHYLADVMGSIAYAPHLGEPEGPALLGGDPASVHEFRFFDPGSALARRTAWELPVEVRDGQVGWGVSGSLLGLDLALGRLSLRRVSRETIPEAPRLSDAVRQAFTESALLTSAFDLTDADRGALLAAVERGRQRVAALRPASPEIERATVEAELDEWRAQAVPWTIAHDSGRRLALFSLAELARLGGLDPARAQGLDAWGTTGFSRDRGLTPIYPVHLPWTTTAGRRGSRGVEALVPDLTIGLAESSARLGLPAALTAGLLLVATQEFIDTLRTAHEDDWLAMVAHAQMVARSRVDDFVAALTISGPLVPDEKEVGHGRH